jgi:bifunctional non-homologous end joining protein LigD
VASPGGTLVSRVGDGDIDVAGRTVSATNTDKTFFPDEGLTKGHLVGYYAAVAEVMAPHVRDRALTLQRFPDGIGRDGFFQKEAGEHFPDWIRRVEVERRGEGGAVKHAVCDEPAAIVYLANQGTITMLI